MRHKVRRVIQQRTYILLCCVSVKESITIEKIKRLLTIPFPVVHIAGGFQLSIAGDLTEAVPKRHQLHQACIQAGRFENQLAFKIKLLLRGMPKAHGNCIAGGTLRKRGG